MCAKYLYSSCFLAFIFFTFTTYVHGFYIEAIMGGYKVEQGKFKHQVSIEVKADSDSNQSSICGGALIDDNYVLSAAHCFINENGSLRQDWFQVRVGTLNIGNKSGTVVDIDAIYVSGNYNWNTLKNDIALIKLKIDLEFRGDSPLSKLNLPSPNVYYERTIAQISGYGFNRALVVLKESGERIIIGSTDYKLKYLNVWVLSNQYCQQQSGYNVPDTELCGQSISLYPDQSWGVCFGDGGSALVYEFKVIGILSRAYFDCIDTASHAKYTRVSMFMSFIRSVLINRPLANTLIFQDPSFH